jgi:5'-nucleotidase
MTRLRARETNPVFIHAGDFFQGTLHFTEYNGNADVAPTPYTISRA